MTSCLDDAAALETLFRELLSTWPYYRPEHYVHTRVGEPAYLGYVGYPTWQPETVEVTRLEINVELPILYLLSIRLQPGLRGRGIGWQLYELVEELARRLGCHYLEQTPSGTTYSRQSRAEYLAARGYTLVGGVAVKELRDAKV